MSEKISLDSSEGGYENIYRLFLNPSFFNKLRLRLLLCLK